MIFYEKVRICMTFAVVLASKRGWRWVLAIATWANGGSGRSGPCAWLVLSCKAALSRRKRPRKLTGCDRVRGGAGCLDVWGGAGRGRAPWCLGGDVRAGRTLSEGRGGTLADGEARRACLFRDGVEARRGAVVSCERLLAYPNYQRTPCLKEHLGLEPADAYRFLRRREALASFFCV